ncbi:Core-2/I-Branching enzyme [Ancylostoma ceylanicum]|uniref:Core-2/I-Branching enzyme n=1 Tax=Ancylostoma ceylanicum TaxID=53326 RepID=A0A0D6LQ81_9BILA|nr:Core-2/I-Branching enzyme [Ancylostoma ceylanicum]
MKSKGTSAFAHGLNTIVNMLFSQEEYTSYVAKNRPTIVHNDQNVSCAQLRRRILPPTSMKPIPLGVAFARIDYELIEDELRSSYHPQNYFCYSIDQKADKKFRSNMKRLAQCLPNVTLMQFPHITANKMLPEFDYGVIECVHETIFNRTFLDQTDHPLDRDIYANMANVKYHKNRRKPDPNFKLECVRAQRNIDELYTASRELS